MLFWWFCSFPLCRAFLWRVWLRSVSSIRCQYVSVKVYMVINVLQLLRRTKLKEWQLPPLFSMFAAWREALQTCCVHLFFSWRQLLSSEVLCLTFHGGHAAAWLNSTLAALAPCSVAAAFHLPALVHQLYQGFSQPQVDLVCCTLYWAGSPDSRHMPHDIPCINMYQWDSTSITAWMRSASCFCQGLWLAMHASIAAHSFGAAAWCTWFDLCSSCSLCIVRRILACTVCILIRNR